MHSSLNQEYARAAADARERAARGRRAPRPEPPPGRLRQFGARALGAVAARLDRETARRVVA